jgi:hypothetical protein
MVPSRLPVASRRPSMDLARMDIAMIFGRMISCRTFACRTAAATLLAAVLASTAPAVVAAQDAAAAARNAVQSTLYFGLKSQNGAGVSEQEWAAFLAEVVTPRFPDGLTVVSAYGQGSSPGPDAVLAELTKVLIIVHSDNKRDAEKIAEIKAKYSKQFDQPGVFHTESDVRIVP